MRRIAAALLLASLAAASPALSRQAPPPLLAVPAPMAAAPPSPRPIPPPKTGVVLSKPEWVKLPSAEDTARYYPEHASRLGLGGKAVISCTVSNEGTLEDCEVVSETPEGESFGLAAVRISRLFVMKPVTRDGAPVGGATVRIPITFQAPEPSGAGAEPAPPPATGRFAFLGVEPFGGRSERADTPVASYLRLPDAAPQDGKVGVWVLLVFPPENGKPMVWMTEQAFDCSARSMRLVSMQIFANGERVQSMSGGGDWTPAASPTMNQALDLACGRASPDKTLLDSTAAVAADGARRLAR